MLEGYRGYLQIDGYEGDNAGCAGAEITPLGCWAHTRRRFDEAVNAPGKNAHPTKTRTARQGLAYSQPLYRIEQEVRGTTAEARYHARQQKAQPILETIRPWFDAALPEVPPTRSTGKALSYLHPQWERLGRYLDEGRLEIDNNLGENSIRPFVGGRRNGLFCDTGPGAKASANLYSVIETAKANALEPYHYLRHVFTELPKVTHRRAHRKAAPS